MHLFHHGQKEGEQQPGDSSAGAAAAAGAAAGANQQGIWQGHHVAWGRVLEGKDGQSAGMTFGFPQNLLTKYFKHLIPVFPERHLPRQRGRGEASRSRKRSGGPQEQGQPKGTERGKKSIL